MCIDRNLSFQANIFNTEQMIAPPQQIKIQYNAHPILQVGAHSTPEGALRAGNSHIYAKSGHWSEQQKLRYLMFIDYHNEKLQTKEKRRESRVFKAMSTFIKTRKPNQCRTHHYKMESYFQSTHSIISYFKDKIHNYLDEYEKSQRELARLDFGLPTRTDHCNMQESISNNEAGSSKQIRERRKKGKGSRTSIRVADDELNHQPNDKNLPKTDQSLYHPSPQEEEEQRHSARPTLSFSFIQNETVGYNIGMGLYPYWSQEHIPQMEGFFEYYKRNSSSETQLREWSECEQLYLQWRSKYESLTQRYL